MSIWTKIRPVVEAALVICLVSSAIYFTDHHPSKNSLPSDIVDIGQTSPFKEALLRAHGLHELRFQPLQTATKTPLICANFTYNPLGLVGVCQYLVPIGMQGCCLADPVDLPSLDSICPTNQVTPQYIQCARVFQSYWCNAVCNPYLISNLTCSARFANISATCAPVCPGLLAYIPTPVLGSNNLPVGNDTVCYYPILNITSIPPQIVYFGVGNAGTVVNNLGTVTQSPTVYFRTDVNGSAPIETLIQLMSGGQLYFGFSIPQTSWAYLGTGVYEAILPAFIDLNTLQSQSAWNFTVIVNVTNAAGSVGSSPIYLTLVNSAPVSANITTLNIGGCGGVGGGSSGAFNNTLPNGSVAATSIANLNCLCASQCTFTTPVTTQVQVQTLQITAAVTNYSSNVVVKTSVTLGSSASQMVLSTAAALSFQCTVNISSSYQFTGAGSVVSFSSSTSTFSAPVTFSGPAVTVNANTVISLVAASIKLATTTVLTIVTGGSINLDSSSSIFGSAGTLSSTVLYVVGGKITGSGLVKLKIGIITLSKSIIGPAITLNTGLSSRRQTSSQATTTTCGDNLQGGVTLASNTQLTVDESCTVPTSTSNSLLIGNTLTVGSGATLLLLNVSNTSKPIGITGTFSFSGSLIVNFAQGASTVLSVSILTYTSGTCTAPSKSSVTLNNAPVSTTSFSIVASSSSGVCTVSISALATSSTYTLTLNQSINTFGATNFYNALAGAGISGYNPSLVQVLNVTSGSVIITFNCLGPDPNTAQTLCNTIYYQANLQNSYLNSQLQPISFTTTTTSSTSSTTSTTTTTTSSTSSSTSITVPSGTGTGGNQNGLLGLIALVAILPIVLIIIWIYKWRTPTPIKYEDTGKDFELQPGMQPQPLQPQPYGVAPAQYYAPPAPGQYYTAPAPVQFYASATPAPTPAP